MADPTLAQLDTVREPGGGAAGVPVWRGAAAAPRPARHRRHVFRVHPRAADQRHPRDGPGTAAGGKGGELRATHDWRPAVRMTPWTAATEGHMIVVEPNGTTQAWPAYDQPDLFLYLGNLLEEPVTAIWDRYPYQASHYAKYLGRSIYTATRTAR